MVNGKKGYFVMSGGFNEETGKWTDSVIIGLGKNQKQFSIEAIEGEKPEVNKQPTVVANFGK